MAKRKIIIRLITILMAGLFITTAIPAHTISLENTAGIAPIIVEAAESFPDLSDSSYCETIAPKKISVYKDSDLNTRGTCSPSKAYNSYIDKNDDLRLLKITSNYIKVSFPTPNGRKTGFIARNELIGDSAPSAVSKANGKGTTYTSPGGKSYGYYESGDRVYKVGNSGAYTAVIYTAKSKNRAYKLAWTRTDDYNRYCQGSGGNNSSGKLSEALYHNSGAFISCGFDGYKNTSR